MFSKRAIPEESRKIFEDATTGPLRDIKNNKYDAQHRIYNEAANEIFESFLFRNGIDETRLTPSHARKLLQEVFESSDPRIRNYNMRLWLREIMRRVPRSPRGNE